MKQRTTVTSILGLFFALCRSTAHAQEPAPAATPAIAQESAPAPTSAIAPTQDATTKQVDAVGMTEPRPTPKQFAFTFNPLNLIIGRYGFNFEYQPVPHHGLIVTPHYDHGADSGLDSGDDTLNGVGAELGYRFYSGKQGFDGFFAGPSLLIATNKITSSYSGSDSSSFASSSVGLALDVGGQWQLDHFIIGGGAGVQYTRNNKRVQDSNIATTVNGGGWLPRLAFNLGYAF